MGNHSKSASQLHFEHRLWLNRLEFYQQELEIFQHRLAEVLQLHDEHDITAQAEHLQNSFIRQNEVLDRLLRDVRVHEQHLAHAVQRDPNASEEVSVTHDRLTNEIEVFEKLYYEIKQESLHFFANNLFQKADN